MVTPKYIRYSNVVQVKFKNRHQTLTGTLQNHWKIYYPHFMYYLVVKTGMWMVCVWLCVCMIYV